MIKKITLILALLLVLICPAMAVSEQTINDATAFNFYAPSGYVLSGLRVGNLPAGENFTASFVSGGDTYILSVESYKDWNLWWNFDLSCQYPNGTTEYKHISQLAPFPGTYDLTVQPYISEGDTIFDIDISVSLLPLNAYFTGNSYLLDYTDIPFSSITGACTHPADITVYISTPAEFLAQQNDNITGQILATIGSLAASAWDQILIIAESIPYLGSYLVTILEIGALLISELVFWIDLIFIQYPELTFLTVEFFIIGDALLSTRSLNSMIKRIIRSHEKLIDFLVSLITRIINAVVSLLELVIRFIDLINPFS